MLGGAGEANLHSGMSNAGPNFTLAYQPSTIPVVGPHIVPGTDPGNAVGGSLSVYLLNPIYLPTISTSKLSDKRRPIAATARKLAEMEHNQDQDACQGTEQTHLYGRACAKAGWITSRIERATVLRVLIFVASLTTAFLAGIAVHLLFMHHTVCF